jgi:hypothetical protein
MDLTVAVLKWISQLLIGLSGVSALFHELTKVDAATGRKRLTAIGRLHLSGIVTGLVLFGATEVRDVRKAAAEREEVRKRDEAQQRQIATLETVRDRQQDMAVSQKSQIEDARALAGAQALVIDTQSKQNTRLRDLLLSAYQLAGVEISISPIDYAFKRYDRMLKELAEEYRNAGFKVPEPQQYFQPCILHGRIEARKGERDQWLLNCTLARPQGLTNPRFYCAPESFQWRAFEGVLDVLLGESLQIALGDGADLVLLNDTSRPSVVSREGRTLKLLVYGTRVKLSQLEKASVKLRMERPGADLGEMPAQIRLRSLDPLVRFDETCKTQWRFEKIGTRTVVAEPGDDPVEVDIKATVAGPFPLKVELDTRFQDLPQSPRPEPSLARALK